MPFPGVVIDDALVSVFYSTRRGFGLGGRVAFSIPNVGDGVLAATFSTGAGIGSTVGAIVATGQYDDPLASVVAGGVLGATVAAITGRGKKKESPDPEFEEYLRALSACMEARGYELVVPRQAEDAEDSSAHERA